MPASLLMVQGTASSAGKSLLAAALCRIFRQDGFRVAPFKAQNMSNNSFVTREGGEMGRAQVVQAQAAGIEPHVDMNPILLKPEADARSQVVVLGRATGSLPARAYHDRKRALLPVVLGALERLRAGCDLVVIEGAGSPAEINLRASDLVNMGLALEVQAPVILAGDIDRGGVFAHLVGTLELLTTEERALVRGLVINKFRGDLRLLDDGLRFLEARTGLPVLGVVPFIRDHGLPDEDSVVLEGRSRSIAPAGEAIDIAVIRLPRIANFTDFDALAAEPAVRLRYVDRADALGAPDVIIIPGTKSTMADLAFLMQRGLAEPIRRAAGAGRVVVGICGGFQMLGRAIRDPEHVESGRAVVEGLGLLPVETIFEPAKRTTRVTAEAVIAAGVLRRLRGTKVAGYEIHNGVTAGEAAPAFTVRERMGRLAGDADGAVSATGNVFGTYIHGLFDEPGFRRAFLDAVASTAGKAATQGPEAPAASAGDALEAAFDRLAATVRASLDMPRIYQIAALTP